MFQKNNALLILFFLGIAFEGMTQDCIKCRDTRNEIPDHFTPLKSPYHMIQLYGDYAFRTTNYYDEHYNGNAGWVEARIIVPYFSEIFKSIFPLPDIYLTATLKDLKDINWEERLDYGSGIEWKPLKRFLFKENVPEDIYPLNWMRHIRFYAVYLRGCYLKDVEDWRPKEDIRAGVELYRECNLYSDYDSDKPKRGDFSWSEYWGDFSYRTTNFYISNFNSWTFGFVPKYGLKFFRHKFFTLMPYITGLIQLTGRSEYWQNRLLLGSGLRLMPFRSLKNDWYGTVFRSLKFYVEYDRIIAYLRDVPCGNVPAYDLFFGINFSINRY